MRLWPFGQHRHRSEETIEGAVSGSLAADIERIKRFHEQPSHPPEVEWYGMDRVVRALLDLPIDMPLYINLHHGIHFNEVDVLEFYRNGDLPIFVVRQIYKELYERALDKACHVFGSPHVWHRRLHGIERQADANGTLAFPAHSTHFVSSRFDLEHYAKTLAELPESFQPVTVCMYWKDLLLQRQVPFERLGMSIVTAGHLFDPQFIQRFYELLPRFKFCTGNDIGSHVVFALEMGIPYFVTGAHPSYVIDAEGDPSAAAATSGSRSKTDWFERLLPCIGQDIVISPALARATAYAHGCSDEVDRDFLRRVLIEEAEQRGNV